MLLLLACSTSQSTHAHPIRMISEDGPSIHDVHLRPHVKELALKIHTKAIEDATVAQPNVMTIIDYELPSTEKRLWVVELKTGETLFHEQVAHGRNSDKNNDTLVDPGGFSNAPKSLKSSIGVFLTQDTYYSDKFSGISLHLKGLEKGFNDNASERAIVMHPADYADVEEGQRVGRSWGCPSVDPDVSDALIETIAGGSVFVQYYPDKAWLKRSEFLK